MLYEHNPYTHRYTKHKKHYTNNTSALYSDRTISNLNIEEIGKCCCSNVSYINYKPINLMFTEPSTEIIGAPDLYIESGSTINLTCVILNSPEPPAYIFWNHNDAVSFFKLFFFY